CYRAGRYEDAVKYLEMQSLSDRPWSGAAAAMIYYRAGRKDEARKWLDRFEAWYEEVPGGAIAGPEYRPPFGNLYWVWAEVLLLPPEAHALVNGAAPKDDKARDAIEAHARRVWSHRAPAPAAFDDALRMQPNLARLWLARAVRRMALKRE